MSGALWGRRPLLQPGEIVSDYHLLRHLGSGGEGDVYVARHAGSGALCTVKIFRGRNTVADVRHTARYFRRLARFPSVKKFYEYGFITNQPSVGERGWTAGEFVRGQTLAHQILKGKVKHPLRMLRAVCDALVPIHQIGMAIGDFDNDRNILIERGTQAIRFCDLDAGTPQYPPPTVFDDLYELSRLARRLDRCCGQTLGRRLLRSLSQAESVIVWQRLLEESD